MSSILLVSCGCVVLGWQGLEKSKSDGKEVIYSRYLIDRVCVAVELIERMLLERVILERSFLEERVVS